MKSSSETYTEETSINEQTAANERAIAFMGNSRRDVGISSSVLLGGKAITRLPGKISQPTDVHSVIYLTLFRSPRLEFNPLGLQWRLL